MIVRIYGKENCPRCEDLKAYFDMKNILFIEYRVGIDIERNVLLKMFPGVEKAPLVTVDHKLIGSLEETIDYFNNKGY